MTSSEIHIFRFLRFFNDVIKNFDFFLLLGCIGVEHAVTRLRLIDQTPLPLLFLYLCFSLWVSDLGSMHPKEVITRNL